MVLGKIDWLTATTQTLCQRADLKDDCGQTTQQSGAGFSQPTVRNQLSVTDDTVPWLTFIFNSLTYHRKFA